MGAEPAPPSRVDPVALGRLLRPRSVAVVGASDVTTSVGGAPLVLLERFGFAGEVYPVSPSRDAINGRACLHSIDELPHGVDAAILAIPRAAVPGALEALSRRGVGGAVVFSSGYAETGPEGAADQRALAAFARERGLALAGPNCLGLVNFVERVPLTFGDASPNRRTRPRGLAILAQSGRDDPRAHLRRDGQGRHGHLRRVHRQRGGDRDRGLSRRLRRRRRHGSGGDARRADSPTRGVPRGGAAGPRARGRGPRRAPRAR
ncbi:MAG: hypothetical protein B7Z69_02150 [Actinobacteria bacterium 21-73-9]|nr:MAG: hypothetical protein B7Z69_02150 [Actinobacteria bacterium 21-73-9]